MHSVYTFLIMFMFWILLSGKFDLFHMTLGIISSGLVTFLSHDLLFHDRTKKGRLAEANRFILYIPWLLREIVTATLYVAYLALHPKMLELIDPKIIRFKTSLHKNIARVSFANSITLTPGTITVRIMDDEYYVHAISKKLADGLPGEMENRIKWVFERD